MLNCIYFSKAEWNRKLELTKQGELGEKSTKQYIFLQLVKECGSVSMNKIAKIKISDIDFCSRRISFDMTDVHVAIIAIFCKISSELTQVIKQYIERYHPETYLFGQFDFQELISEKKIEAFDCHKARNKMYLIV